MYLELELTYLYLGLGRYLTIGMWVAGPYLQP